MLGFDALGSYPLGDGDASSGPVPRPHADQAHFSFDGAAYTRPPATAADFGPAAPAAVTGAGAVTLELTAAAVAVHQAPENPEAVGAVTLELTAAGAAGHGVAGSAAIALDVGAAAAAGHGVAGAAAAGLELAAAAAAGHGVAGAGAAALAITADAIAVHERYELRGEVRQGGILVSRRVRAYLRTTGALIGEADTVAGRFAIHTGFTPAEHYLVPVDLTDEATDWRPDTANRVLSVLAQDA